MTYRDKSIFCDEQKREDIFSLLLNFCSESAQQEEPCPEKVQLAVYLILNLSRSPYRATSDIVKLRVVQQVETLAIRCGLYAEAAKNNFRAQCFFISRWMVGERE